MASRVYDLTLLSRSNVGSTFYDDLADTLLGLVDESKMQRDYQPDVPNAQAYPVITLLPGRGQERPPCSFTACPTAIRRD